MKIDLRRLKIGTLLGVGMTLIIGVLMATTIYSNFLSNRAQRIIENSTTKTFHALAIQRDSEKFFSSLDETIVIIREDELKVARERSFNFLNQLETTIDQSLEQQIFSDEELEQAEEILLDTKKVAERYFELKKMLISTGGDRGRTFEGGYSVESKDLSSWFDRLSNNKYEMFRLVSQVIMRSDKASQEAMSLVGRAQMASWVVVGVSMVLAVVMAFFLVRSARKIFDLKNEFINIIAHDLRNPVTAILGYLDIIMTSDDMKPVEIKKQLKIVEVSTHRLKIQINNLLEVGRTEAGYVKVNLESVSVAKVLEESVARARAFAETKGMSISYDKPVSEEVYVLADKHKLADVIDNLISNAVKYNKKEGSITITSSDEGDNFTISVTDTGYGIPEDKRDKIFKKYSRLESSSKERVGGTGLGLFTVKLSMDQMKGTVTFTTKVDKGTTFTISLQKTKKGEVPAEE